MVHLYHEKQLAALTEKQEKVDDRLGALEMSVQEITTKFDTSVSVQSKILDALEALKEKPGKRWEQVVTTSLSVVVTGAVMYAITVLTR